MESCIIESPVGHLLITANGGAIVALTWTNDDTRAALSPDLDAAAAQLGEYFAGTRRAFDLPLAATGTRHQRGTWQAMVRIAYGETQTYGELARRIGSSARAVGGACGANPIAIVVPCHRVLGAGTRIGGYSGGRGPATKTALLRLEGAAIAH